MAENTAKKVTVTVPREILYDIDKMQALTRKLLGRLGCPGCHSGVIFNFQEEVEFVVRNQQGGEGFAIHGVVTDSVA
jgi:hypothetical protein